MNDLITLNYVLLKLDLVLQYEQEFTVHPLFNLIFRPTKSWEGTRFISTDIELYDKLSGCSIVVFSHQFVVLSNAS